jgi:hypothetical protein
MEGFGLTVDEADLDSDKDGAVNLVEYALGGSPLDPTDKAKQPEIQATDSTGFNYIYMRRKDYASRSLSYSVEAAESLSDSSWSTYGVFEIGTNSISENFEEVKNRVSIPSGQGFARLQINLAE